MPVPMLTPPLLDPIEIISHVTSFYETAWSHLLWFIGVTGAIVGIMVPIGIQIYQRRLFRVEEAKIRRELGDQIRADLEQQMKTKFADESKRIDEKLTELTESMKQAVANSDGRAFFLQGRMLLDKKQPAGAARSFTTAALSYLRGNDQSNLQKALTQLETCLKSVKTDTLEKLGHRPLIEKLIVELKENDEAGRYTNYIDRLTIRLNWSGQPQVPLATHADDED